MESQKFNSQLRKAFNLIRKQGIVVKTNFWCCQTCGLSDIDNHFKKDTKGYCFYHNQDNDSKKAGEDFYLCYGNTGDKAKHTAQQIGTIIVRCLNQAEIKNNWTGDTSDRILIYGYKEGV
jgi:hypothetical protein